MKLFDRNRRCSIITFVQKEYANGTSERTRREGVEEQGRKGTGRNKIKDHTVFSSLCGSDRAGCNKNTVNKSMHRRVQ